MDLVLTIHFHPPACYASVAEYTNLVGVTRWICLRYQLQSDPVRLWLALLPGGAKAIEALNTTPLQKFSVRQMRSISDYAMLEDSTKKTSKSGTSGLSARPRCKQREAEKEVEVAENDEEDREDDEGGSRIDQFQPTRLNPLYMMTHGMMLLTSRSYQSAIGQSPLCLSSRVVRLELSHRLSPI